jgi:hypothetical protein
MKTKIYTFLTGLLMAACLTSYGQEIVGEFMLQCDKEFWNCDIEECTDGSLVVGTYSTNMGSYTLDHYFICKVTPEGELLDSVTLPYGWQVLAHPTQPDVFVIPSYNWDEADSTLSFRMTFMDADLHITEEILAPVFVGVTYEENPWALEDVILDPHGDFIITLWTDIEMIEYWATSAVFHLMRVGLDGSVIYHKETDRILPPNWSNMHPSDTALMYEYFGIYDETPLQYYKMGGYIGEDNEHPWPLYAYVFDAKLDLVDTLVYSNLSEPQYFDWAGMEHITPFGDNTQNETYLLAAQVCYGSNNYAASIAKYDRDHNRLAIHRVEPTTNKGYGTPIITKVVDENTIYHAYQSYPTSFYNEVMSVARLDGDLNVEWNINLPGDQSNYGYGHCLRVLRNGDIAAGFISLRNAADRLYLYIIHDDYDAIPETTTVDCPFTIYPNPVNDLLTLRFDDGTLPESVELYDLAGRLVGTKPNGLESIDISTMTSGVYMLRVTMKDGTRYHEKVLKE